MGWFRKTDRLSAHQGPRWPSSCSSWAPLSLGAALSSYIMVALAATDVLTSRNDLARTGTNLSETTLTVANVNSTRFGRLFSYRVQGNVYAQPLVVSNVETPIGLRNVLYIATTDNVVYAFDADTNAASDGLIWSRSFGELGVSAQQSKTWVTIPFDNELQIPVQPTTGIVAAPIPWDDPVHWNKATTFLGNVGIVSTPVIDKRRNTLFLLVRTREQDPKKLDQPRQGITYVQSLHALDLRTGAEKPNSPVIVAQDSATGLGFAEMQNQRPGLALANDQVIVAWGGPGGIEGSGGNASRIRVGNNITQYYGYVTAYDADTLMQRGCFTTGTGERAGIGLWQSGRAPAVDTNGNVYFFTGNGAAQAPDVNVQNLCGNGSFSLQSGNLSNSLIELDTGNALNLVDVVPDVEQIDLDRCHMDLSGSGPLLVPGTSVVIGGGKRGFLVVWDKGPSGRYAARQRVQVYSGLAEPLDDVELCRNIHGRHHIMGGPVYWEGAGTARVYISAESEHIRAYQFDKNQRTLVTANFVVSPESVAGHPGAILTLSANNAAGGTGILWAVHADHSVPAQCPAPDVDPFFLCKARGVLRAYDAEDVTRELWNSKGDPQQWDFAKFTPATVANGKVYLPTFSGQIIVFGLK